MKNIKKISIAALSAAIATVGITTEAAAQDRDTGFYVSGSVGLNVQSDHNFSGIQAHAAGVPGVAGAPANINVDYDNGINLTGAVGYSFNSGIISFLKPRVELEVSYSDADVNAGSFNGGTQTFSGNTSTTFVKAALYSDIVWKDNQKVIPYFGSGIGIGIVDANVNYFPGTATAPTVGVNSNRTGLATHSSLGVTWKATDAFDLYAEGRYSRVSRRTFDRRFLATNGLNARVRDNTESLAFSLGARVKF